MHVKTKAPMDEVGSMCRNCMKMVCPRCASGPCVPFLKKLELEEKRFQALRSYGLA
jgi:predicted transcriptional regulator